MGNKNKFWWENRFKYNPFAQRFFLFFSLSCQFPKTLNIEPTNFCNLACFFCPTAKTNRPKGYLKLDLYRKIIRQITQGKKLKVFWLNKDGEPLLHPQIDKMIKYAKEKGVAERIEIYTNGLLLDAAMSRRLIKAGLDSLVVSLDATNRQKDAYGKVVANIEDFLRAKGENKPLLGVKLIDWGNQREMAEFRKQWQNRVDNIFVQPLHQWEGSIKLKVKSEKLKIKRRYPCNLPWLAPAINWDGKLVPCCVNYKENELMMGDLNKESLSEIWLGQKYKRLRRAHLDQDFSGFPTCAACAYWQMLPNMGWWLRRIGV